MEELQHVLQYWEQQDGVTWGEVERLECADYLISQPYSVAEWKARLLPVPDQVEQRYRKVVALLVQKRLITTAMQDAEHLAMTQFSPALLTRRGKEFADWVRSTD